MCHILYWVLIKMCKISSSQVNGLNKNEELSSSTTKVLYNWLYRDWNTNRVMRQVRKVQMSEETDNLERKNPQNSENFFTNILRSVLNWMKKWHPERLTQTPPLLTM